jgi:4-amino-4-deoxy-L-arabinose transferase-like glycosyltransferase
VISRQLARWERLAPPAAIGLASAHALRSGWGRWGDLIIDTGRELEVPRRILEGEVLYADLRFYYGPLAPYVNAALYAIFGVHLDVLSAAGAVSGVLVAVTVYLLARSFVGRLGATAAAISFVYVCGFAALSQHNFLTIYNFVVPYAYAATYGMLAALGSLLFLVRHLGHGRGRDLVVSASLLVLASLSKVEALLPALAVHVVALGALAAERRLRAVHARVYVGAALATGTVYAWFYLRAGPSLWLDNLAGPVNAGSREFVLGMMGLDDPWANLARAAVSVGALLAIGLAGHAVSTAARERTSTTARWTIVLAAGAAVFAFVRLLTPGYLHRAVPLLAAVAFAAVGVAWWKRRRQRSEVLPHALLWTFVLASVPRIVLAAVPDGYGFFLLPAGIVGMAVLLFGYLPRTLGDSTWARRSFAAIGAAALLGNAASAFATSDAVFTARSFEIGLPRGTLWVPSAAGLTGRWSGPQLLPILDALDRYPFGTRLAAVPYGSALNFLSALPGARDGMSSYLPMELTEEREDAVVASWTAAPPDLVLWVDPGELDEFGGARFGSTYGTRCARFIRANYRPVTAPGSTVLLARSSAPVAAWSEPAEQGSPTRGISWSR